MPIDVTGTMWVYETPQDGDLSGMLASYIDESQPGLGLYGQIYAATLDSFFAAATRAYTRGCVEKVVLDSSQGQGHTEAQKLSAFLPTVDKGQWALGTSMQAHQLVHDKKLLANVPITPQQEAAVAAVDPRQYLHWQDALAAGYPVAWFGSWNFSPAASHQVNTLVIVPSLTLVCYFRDLISTNFDWIRAHEPGWDTITAAWSHGMYDLTALSES